MANYKDIKYDFSGENLTALDAANIGSNKVPTARLGSGTASSSTVLYGDQTYKTEPSGITQANFLPTAAPIIINGNMAVAQRATSSAGITGNAYFTVDRWKHQQSTAGTWTQTREALTADEAFEDGFANAYKMDCTTANASLDAASYIHLRYFFEGQDLQVFKKGTSNAETYTLSFWIKSTKTGTFVAELYDNDNDRGVSTAYTVSSTDTWEKKVVAFPADTTGVMDDNNGNSLQLYLWFAAGTNYTTGTLQTSWGAQGDGTDRAVGQVNCADSDSNNYHITGMQLEVGTYTSSDLPPFQHESYGDNLLRCFRYFYKDNDGTNTELMSGLLPLDGSHSKRVWVQFKTPMRATPAQENSSWSGGGTISSNASQFLNKYSAEAYARDNDDTNAIYYDGSEWNAEL